MRLFDPVQRTLQAEGAHWAPSVVLWLAVAGLVFAGGAAMVSGLFRMTMWNESIPDRVRGRLAGIEMLSYGSGPTLGNVEAGAAASLLGLPA